MISSAATDVLYLPHTVSIHLTDICNNKCMFCSEASHEHKHDSIRKEDILDFLQNQNTAIWNTLNIHGGEPTVTPILLDVVRFARNLGFSWIMLQTNAHKIGTDEAYTAELIAAGVDFFNIGFHGSTSEIMDGLTQVPGSYEKGLRGIRAIAKYQKPIRITVVVCATNYMDLPELVRLAAAEGISCVHIAAMQTGGSALDNLDKLCISYSEAAPYIKQAVHDAEKLGISVIIEGFPHCVLRGTEEYLVDWTDIQLKMMYRKMVIDNYNEFLNKTIRSFGNECTTCAKKSICNGVYREYATREGWEEFHPYI